MTRISGIIIAALLTLCPLSAFAAIAQDATSKGTTASGSTATIAHTVTGSNMLLLVGGVTIGNATDVVTGMTYNGVAMTRLDSQGYAGVARAYVYYLLGPAAGTHDIVVSMSDTTHSTQFQGLSYSGVSQTGQPDATRSNAASVAASVTNTLTTIADNALHIAYVRVDDHAPNGTTGLFVVGPGSPGTEGFYTSNPATVHPAGSNSIQVSWSATQTSVAIGASFSPAAAAPAAAPALQNVVLFGDW